MLPCEMLSSSIYFTLCVRAACCSVRVKGALLMGALQVVFMSVRRMLLKDVRGADTLSSAENLYKPAVNSLQTVQ